MNHSSPLRPVPTSPRELLMALGEMPAEFTLDEFLDRFDYRGVTPHQAIYSTLGRLPKSADAARMGPGYDARRHYGELLLSTEFQGRIILQTLQVFPEKKRVFFVHVPKCAGTDLMAHLYLRYPDLRLEHYMMSSDFLPPLQVLWRLRAIVSKRDSADAIAVIGHLRLHLILAHGLIRFGDEAFSVIREPVDMALSLVNFGLTVRMNPDRHQPLPHRFANAIGLKERTLPSSGEECKALARRWLRNPEVLSKSGICEFLGHGDFDSALDLTTSANIELTTVSRYEAWLAERWGVTHSPRANTSQKYLCRADLSEDDLAYLTERSREDARFYQLVDARLAALGRNALFASELL